MSITSVDKDFDNLTLTLVADLAAPIGRVRMTLSEHAGGTRMELRSVFDSREQLDQLLSMGAVEGLQQAVGQMDALLAGEPASCRGMASRIT